MKEPRAGDRIRVKSRHWCRGNAEGVVEERTGPDSYQVLFDEHGYGFDGGHRLILNSLDFTITEEVSSGS